MFASSLDVFAHLLEELPYRRGGGLILLEKTQSGFDASYLSSRSSVAA